MSSHTATNNTSRSNNNNSNFNIATARHDPNKKIKIQVLETIRNSMPLGVLFRPKLNIDLKVFIDGQVLFLKIAKFLAHIDEQGSITRASISNLFEKNQVLLIEIKALFKQDSTPYLLHFYDVCCDVVNKKPVTHYLKSAIEKRIFTLKNALIAQQDPGAFSKNQTQHPTIKEEGKSFIRNCLSLHLQALKNKKPVLQKQIAASETFQQQLTAVAEQLIPFTQEITERYLKECGIEWAYPATFKNLTRENHHGIVAATVMEVSLSVLGYKTQILTRSDLEPKVTLASVHRVIEVKGPSQKYMVDPSYIQFHMDAQKDEKLLPKEPVLVLEETQIANYIQKNIMAHWKPQFQLVPNGEKDATDLIATKSFKRVWDLSTYTPVRLDMVCQEMFFGMRPDREKTYTYIKSLNLPKLMMDRPSFVDILEILKQYFYPVSKKNDEVALSLIAGLPLELRISHKELLDLDPRIEQTNTILNAYYCSLRKMVNPQGKDLSVIYGCSGSDCMSVLLATDASELVFVDLTKAALADFKQALEKILNSSVSNLKNSLDPKDFFVSTRAHYMGSISLFDLETGEHTMLDLALKLFLDLSDMGVDLHTVNLSAIEDGVCIQFPWQYHNASDLRLRTLTFVNADITKPDRYPALLKRRVEEGFDIFYMKAAFYVPLSYPQFLPTIGKFMRKGGWLMTSDEAYSLETVNPEICLKQNALTFVQQKNEEADRLAKYLSTPSGIAKPPAVQAQQPRENLRPAQGLSYWTILNLRQKVQ